MVWPMDIPVHRLWKRLHYNIMTTWSTLASRSGVPLAEWLAASGTIQFHWCTDWCIAIQGGTYRPSRPARGAGSGADNIGSGHDTVPDSRSANKYRCIHVTMLGGGRSNPTWIGYYHPPPLGQVVMVICLTNALAGYGMTLTVTVLFNSV